jgi:tetratricopeptide (TPR) repeat protein
MRWIPPFLIGLITVSAILLPLTNLRGQGIETYPDLAKCTDWAMAGNDLSTEEAAKLEKQVAANPDDMESRVKLLGYYQRPRIFQEDARKAAQAHIIWLIQNKPTSYAASSAEAQVMKTSDEKRYQECADLWEMQMKKNPDNALIIGNAAEFYLMSDRQRSETLLKRAAELQPKNSFWPERLGNLYALKGEHGLALAAYEKAAEKESGESRFYRLNALAWEAFKSENYAKAETYAKDLLNMAKQFQTNWNHGNAIYDGNSVLGLVTLQKNVISQNNEHEHISANAGLWVRQLEQNTTQAKQYLLAAGESKGSPQLDSFGPNMLLAQKLLELGEKETVLQHLDQLGKFWKMDEGNLAKWKEQIQRGETPKFKTY